MATRRDFLKQASVGLSVGLLGYATIPDASARRTGTVMTVTGPVGPDDLGFTLTHEHVFSTFGLESSYDPEYDYEQVTAAVLLHLRQARSLGCSTLVDATAAYFGRDPVLLQQLSEQSGLQIITNTGYYGAANDAYVPAHAYQESPEQLSRRWSSEWADGINGTGVRPGFMKIGVDAGPLSEIDRKLVTAAALTHRETGLTMAVHTGNNAEAATQQLAILEAVGVAPSAWIWVHAHQVDDEDALLAAARAGAWLSLDGYRPDRMPRFLELLGRMKGEGYLSQVLLSHDGDTYPRKGEASARPFTALMQHLIPAIIENGFTSADIDLLTRTNPSRAFQVRTRMR